MKELINQYETAKRTQSQAIYSLLNDYLNELDAWIEEMEGAK